MKFILLFPLIVLMSGCSYSVAEFVGDSVLVKGLGAGFGGNKGTTIKTDGRSKIVVTPLCPSDMKEQEDE